MRTLALAFDAASGSVFRPQITGILVGCTLFGTVGGGPTYLALGGSISTVPMTVGAGTITPNSFANCPPGVAEILSTGFIPLRIPVNLETVIVVANNGGSGTLVFEVSS